MSSNFLPKAAGAVAILGVVSGVASAQTTFTATAAVQNALTVVNEQNMNLGTLFAIAPSSTAYKYVTLDPAGDYGDIEGAATVVLLTLGGQQAARASVAVGGSTPVKITLPSAEVAGLETAGTAIAAVSAALGTAVQVRVADPGVARFFLTNFRMGNVSGGALAASCSDASTCTITPSFASTGVSFGIGATLVTDILGGTSRSAYEAATNYTGSFVVTASY